MEKLLIDIKPLNIMGVAKLYFAVRDMCTMIFGPFYLLRSQKQMTV